MISSDLQVMQKQLYNFLRSITIKYEPLGALINDALLQAGYAINFNDKTTWKYYINMIGEYHSTDTMMTVTSLDTRETINFERDVIKNHPRTRAAYIPGGQFYKRLCETYPYQVDLIKSILFPVESMEKALLADDLTLLAYGSGFLEADEEPILIMDIEEYLNIYQQRWHLDFLNDEPLFDLAAFGKLFPKLAAFITAKRVSYIKTPYVHDYHIWSELADRGIGNYSDILNREKAMMLYQNIDYLRDNAGKHNNLIILVNRLLSDFGIGLYGRRVVQDIQTDADNYQLTPSLVPIRIPTNYAQLATEIATVNVATMQARIFDKGLTASDSAETVKTVERHLSDTTWNEYPTKFLEIRPIAKNIPFANMMSNFLLETLIVSIAEGYYENQVSVKDPITGTIIYLKPSELLALYSYAVNKTVGVNQDIIPTHVHVQTAFLTQLGTPINNIMVNGRKTFVSSQISATEWLDGITYNTSIQSPSEFTDMVTSLWLKFMYHKIQDMKTSLDVRRGIIAYLSSLCYQKRVVNFTLVPGRTSYADWLGSEGLDLSSGILSQYDRQDDPKTAWQKLADAIMIALIPANDIIKSFGDFTLPDYGYSRIRELFIQLCSYRVVFLDSSRSSPAPNAANKVSTDQKAVRVEDINRVTQIIKKRLKDSIGDKYVGKILPSIEHDHVTRTTSSHRTVLKGGGSIISTSVIDAGSVPKAFERKVGTTTVSSTDFTYSLNMVTTTTVT